MLKNYTRFFAVLSFAFISSNCNAEEYIINNMPCVSEICIGDGLDKLAKVNFDKVSTPTNSKAIGYSLWLNNKEKAKIQFRGNLDSSLIFLAASKFDHGSLKSLENVKANCQPSIWDGLKGTYRTKEGNLTTVTLNLIPSIDSLQQTWTVTSIDRKFNIKSEQQRKEVGNLLANRYSDLNLVADKSNGRGEFKDDNLHLYLLNASDKERMMLHPLCGGSNAVKID